RRGGGARPRPRAERGGGERPARGTPAPRRVGSGGTGAVLRCLTQHLGVRKVLSEGMVEGEAEFDKLKASELYAVGEMLAGQVGEVRGLIKGAERGSEKHGKAQAIEADVLGELAKHRLDVLPLGAPLRLFGAGQLDDVLPLDDAALLDRAKPAPGRP